MKNTKNQNLYKENFFVVFSAPSTISRLKNVIQCIKLALIIL